ncbi:MAG TPA: zinc-dependent alcohol dehydrogenase family protein [Candidatus Polarisedimenticolia bacterium]|nr:zinc-dependent alcohol dehydrogenase family protein [Candidatus Polarisedimenticolia bacterium]
MRAWLLYEPSPVEQQPLRAAQAPEPIPAEGELLIQVKACGVCRTDLHVVEGELPLRRSPLIPGHQVVGEVAATGPATAGFTSGDRVGVAWLHRTCGGCRFCLRRRENLCERADFTGYSVHGGFAERITAPAAFVHRIPDGFDDVQAAPLLCAGIIGYRALRCCGLEGAWPGARLGLYGFGAAGHVAIQVARARGAEIFVCTRDRGRHQSLALELGAAWVGDAAEPPPHLLDAAILFAPAGELVPVALRALDKGGTLVLAGIHMSPLPRMDYSLIYGERVVRSVANNTRDDARDFLEEAARIPVRTQVKIFPFDQANEALAALKNDAIRGAGVVTAPAAAPVF